MTSEITSLAPAAAATAATRPMVPSGELLKLVQPIDSLLAVGESAKAEVLALKQGSVDFTLLLKLTLASGAQTTVQALSSQPLAQGTQLTLTSFTPGSLAIASQQASAENVRNLTQLDTAKLPVGTLLQGTVVTTQALPAVPGLPNVYRSMVTLLNTALAGTTLTLDSPQPLRLGSLLSAQVQGNQALSFVPLTGRLDQLALAQQLNTQQTRQASLQGLLANLQNPDKTAALPADARATLTSLLASLPSVEQLGSAKTVAQALQNSGLFLEPQLLSGQASATAPDLKGYLLRLVAQLAPGLPANTNFNPNAAATTLAQAMPGYVRSALGMLGQVGAKPQLGGFPLPSRHLGGQDGEHDLEHLLRLAAAAISRLQSHQLSSLEQTGTDADGKVQTTWQLEIPMRNLQDIVPLQVKIQREDTPEPDHPDPRDPPKEPRQRLWRVELAFDLTPLGPLQVQAQFSQGNLSSQLWAELPATAALIESQLGNLRERLTSVGLNITDLGCHHGTPPRGPRTHLEHRWVDEKA
ncbi:flagellar hook-length control protein FliK [Pseudomonas sp. nanlin1]|uniref:flagellar hook-length control protein FliK n=1 Tax=Pseudomonas sp. nanlin1 TaxID=3040605 RepID=UPI00388F222A